MLPPKSPGFLLLATAPEIDTDQKRTGGNRLFPRSPGLRPGRSIHRLLQEPAGSARGSQLPRRPFFHAEHSLPAKPSPWMWGPQVPPAFLGRLTSSLSPRTPLESGPLPRGPAGRCRNSRAGGRLSQLPDLPHRLGLHPARRFPSPSKGVTTTHLRTSPSPSSNPSHTDPSPPAPGDSGP